ncbi:hypothetical protein N781_02075 [Pontibacillus halophilus JSM 076056 = DSM 19796]|uniref:Sin domain-containing protein n=1 Tax=Pontibacillus halophilus JSM 076056 = DSM 19796 TaxID=1385510 RepID=A0A0A5IE43_9BACI|nr:anti-repressor SinI family protein [Pontibacillus halophilus]KGX94102.1 hypothetical protein N781_02075 [Pontibacillus halophilus JSM 076056 = DSM 19796]
MVTQTRVDKQVDVEWVQLVSEAKRLGISKEEVREMLRRLQREYT